MLSNSILVGTPPIYSNIRCIPSRRHSWFCDLQRCAYEALLASLRDVNRIFLQEKKYVYYYTPTISETDFVEARTKEFLHKVYGGDVKHLISTMLSPDVLTPEELEDVREFWTKKAHTAILLYQ
ncbi:BlaI/MecI/CopY family transcriptional regulator [Marinisporobacter balticus]|uniref:BlaI/MecI/CopY family transcriptional regulator n=1 Tax=Marinisporobacter balticus TaxID=2018667 RepID=UPI0038CC1823